MKANVIPRHEPVRLPAAFVHWWLSEPAPRPPHPDTADYADSATSKGAALSGSPGLPPAQAAHDAG
ncbi:hypothetical protein ABH931_004530 [Streptacidiphilus sp. MAP12-33]|uniref:hypothetical protein n=1 Tax=Streptacidiphilus sp. MAP12-33 TaxID=3156266 RepID=UPI0035150E8E